MASKGTWRKKTRGKRRVGNFLARFCIRGIELQFRVKNWHSKVERHRQVIENKL
jgi:hypothetical protein